MLMPEYDMVVSRNSLPLSPGWKVLILLQLGKIIGKFQPTICEKMTQSITKLSSRPLPGKHGFGLVSLQVCHVKTPRKPGSDGLPSSIKSQMLITKTKAYIYIYIYTWFYDMFHEWAYWNLVCSHDTAFTIGTRFFSMSPELSQLRNVNCSRC